MFNFTLSYATVSALPINSEAWFPQSSIFVSKPNRLLFPSQDEPQSSSQPVDSQITKHCNESISFGKGELLIWHVRATHSRLSRHYLHDRVNLQALNHLPHQFLFNLFVIGASWCCCYSIRIRLISSFIYSNAYLQEPQSPPIIRGWAEFSLFDNEINRMIAKLLLHA